MSVKKKKNPVPKIIMMFIAVFMIMIYFFSSQKADDTNAVSFAVCEKFAKLIYFQYDSMSAGVQEQIVKGLNMFVRKAAHFSIFSAMGFMIFLASHIKKISHEKGVVLTMLICTAYAVADEFHQLFVDGRTPLAKDVIIDSAGAFAGIFICYTVIVLCDRLKKSKFLKRFKGDKSENKKNSGNRKK